MQVDLLSSAHRRCRHVWSVVFAVASEAPSRGAPRLQWGHNAGIRAAVLLVLSNNAMLRRYDQANSWAG